MGKEDVLRKNKIIETTIPSGKLISVIVPIYNVEKCMDRCINSIVKSTYRSLEIILVDDGSPDQCGQKCDSWVEKDDRIKVIHKKNGGLSDARNSGVAIAQGEYIGFVDSDDYIEPEMYEVLLKAIIQTGSDISMCYAIEEIDKDEGSQLVKCYKGQDVTVLSSEEAIIDLFTVNYYTRHAAWNKLYRKDIFEKERFPNGRLFEDATIMYRIFDSIEQIVCVNSQLYHYVQRYGSISNSTYNPKAILDRINNGYNAVEYFKSRTMLSNMAKMWCLREFPKLYCESYKNKDSKTCKEIVTFMRRTQLGSMAFRLKGIARLKAIIFIISPNILQFMRRIKCLVLEKNTENLDVRSKSV